MFKILNKFVLVLFLANICASHSMAKTYTILVEPNYPNYQIKEVYEPLKQWLSANTGYDIEIIVDPNYYFYWLNAKGDSHPDFTFDASHIALYRNLVKNYTPLLTTIEPIAFHLVSKKALKKNETIEEFFKAKRIAMISRPSYAVELFHQWFDNDFSSPKKHVTSISWQDTIEDLFHGSVDAAIVPEQLKKLYPNLVTILKSKDIQGPTFMASPHVPKEVVDDFNLALLLMNNNPKANHVLSELNTHGFMPVDLNKFKKIKKDFPYIFNNI